LVVAYAEGVGAILIYINSHDFSVPLNYDNYFAVWNKKVQDKQSELPTINYATGTESLAAIANSNASIDSVMGEYPDMWLYIHGPTHEKAIKTSRLSTKLLTAAEKFSAEEPFRKAGLFKSVKITRMRRGQWNPQAAPKTAEGN